MKSLRLTFLLAAAVLGLSASGQKTVRDLKYEITDSAIVFPESVQADVHEMQRNWYLRNYTVLDTVGRPDIPATDEVITERLHSMPTTIEMPFNPVVRAHVDVYTGKKRALVETMLGLSLYYMPIFEEALEREGLPLELKYLPVIESALNPNAVSRAGATGLWQIMLQTARGLGLEINTLVDERRDPLESSAAAARYLRQLYDIYNDWGLAIAAYNCGPGNINKALKRAGASDARPMDYWDIYYYLPAETRGYVPGFIGATYAMTHYADHGISPALASRPILTDTVHVTDRLHFKAISQVLDIPVEELRVLNPQYRKDIVPGDVKPYPLRLPAQTVYSYLMAQDSIQSASLAFAPRSTVEITDPNSLTTDDGVYQEVTKWHKVRRGETLAQIARKYGVTTKQLKSWNRLRSNKLQRGKSLKIVTRKFVPNPPKKQGDVELVIDTPSPAVADTTSVSDTPEVVPAETPGEIEEILEPQTVEEEIEETVEEAEVEPVVVETPKEKPAPAKAAAKTHRVARGDTLFKIARKYGVTVQQLQDANGISGSDIRPGQRLKIPND